jgi:hypothetical protein
MKRSLVLFLIILLIILGFTYFFWLYEARYFIGRADVSRSSFSIDNSYLFVSPLRAKASLGNNEKIRVTIFILNNQGLGVMGKRVVPEVNPYIQMDIIQGTTDNYGKAIFDMFSTKSGEYYLEISADGVPLKDKAHLTFY